MNLSDTQLIEALLFATGEPVLISDLAKKLGWKPNQASEALENLQNNLGDRGIQLLVNGDITDEKTSVSLVTHPDAGELLAKLRKDELSAPLTRAVLETFATIAYSTDGITKPEIDYIRGVNCGHALRTLLVRGLIEKMANPDDKRSSKYRMSSDALAELGVTTLDQMPEFADVQTELTGVTSEMKTDDAE
ncbi:MAG: SMC-Scp complex subunit ScpB [Candidatus Nomurabacteria bacterium]|nr:SMC-Scp complex subunit ScpB [Candidatus Nomurabacteria bacterium]